MNVSGQFLTYQLKLWVTSAWKTCLFKGQFRPLQFLPLWLMYNPDKCHVSHAHVPCLEGHPHKTAFLLCEIVNKAAWWYCVVVKSFIASVFTSFILLVFPVWKTICQHVLLRFPQNNDVHLQRWHLCKLESNKKEAINVQSLMSGSVSCFHKWGELEVSCNIT